MSLFKRNKEDEGRLPDLPSSGNSPLMPAFPDHHDEEENFERHALPAFPDSPSHNRFSQAAIKDAVGNNEQEFSHERPPAVLEMDEWRPGTLKNNIEPEREHRGFLPPPPTELPQRVMREPRSKTADVFVRLDKFQTAKRNLGEINQKLAEIEEMIRKIRETKLREDQELSSWENDLMQVKSRIQEVNDNIFEKVE